jgi:Acyl-CoA dehydrogenase, N-terminal domain
MLASRIILSRRIFQGALRTYTTHSALPEEHRMVHEMCRKFADEELAPNAGAWDKEHCFPKEAINHLVRLLSVVCSLSVFILDESLFASNTSNH